jgi:5-formyltetrahydrofolate cyclo-ligase
MPKEVYLQRNERLLHKVKELLSNQPVGFLHLFLAMPANKEPDCQSLLTWLWKQNIQTSTTRTNFKHKTIAHFLFDDKTEIEISKKGIPEPVNGTPFDLSKVDMIFVPFLAFDRLGERIGYGGGYYDKILSSLAPNTVKVGLSLSGGMDAFNFVEEHDQPLDMIMTPFETLNIHER